ncbi:hypothetical protein [uncultured Senegalimassilia sp.]|uniref:hypothetical protein n=2 Tax=uncultured Senegalimassilia sp. TaxID=1714350 RepID=UPI0025E79D7E|nr:hypothetical protein [uncultured Senegalimassilia sp.]
MIRLYGERVSRARAGVKKTMSGNKYEVALDETWELFGQYMSGAHAGLCCAISSEPLSEAAETALDSSLAALGYGREACTYIVSADLDPQALFVPIEGLDPICIVAADGKSAALLGQAYHLAVPPGKATRLLGRTAVSFLDFESLLKTPQDKQIAWALLKKLPKFGEKRG